MCERKTAVTLGSFDGLHKGHMTVIACAFEMQKEHGLVPLVLLFDKHPMFALSGKAPDKVLQSSLRDGIIAETGAQKRIVPFDLVKDMTCREFFEEILIEKLNAGGVCCGWNYRFGKNNEGGIAELKALCEEFGVMLKITPPVDFGGEPVSSTRIRQAVESGDVSLANEMLGRPFSISHTVVHGKSLGKKASPEHFFYFDVPNSGITKLVAVSGDLRDEGTIRKVDTFNPDYRLQEQNAVINWFDITMPEGYLSINDKVSDIMKTLRGKIILAGFMLKLAKQMKKPKGEKGEGGHGGTFSLTPDMLQMVGSFTILRMSGMVGMVGVTLTEKDLLKLNAQLNKIKAPKK